MIEFFVFSIVILASSLIKPQKQKYILFCFAFILFLLLGFRAESVGTDTINYKAYFDIIKSGYKLSVEIGWIYLNEAVIVCGGNFNSLLILVAALTIIPIIIIIKKNSVNPLFSLFLYYTLYIYFYSFNISRQTLALSIVFIAIIFLIKNKIIWFVILVLFSSLFHISSLIVIPLVFVNNIPDKKLFYFSSLTITAGIGLFFTNYLVDYLYQINAYSGLFERSELGNIIGNGLYLLVLNTFFFFILFTIRQRNIYLKLFFSYILVTNLLIRIPFSGRVVMYYSMFLLLFFPFYLKNNKFKNNSLLYLIVIVYSYIIYFRSFGFGEILPYINRLY